MLGNNKPPYRNILGNIAKWLCLYSVASVTLKIHTHMGIIVFKLTHRYAGTHVYARVNVRKWGLQAYRCYRRFRFVLGALQEPAHRAQRLNNGRIYLDGSSQRTYDVCPVHKPGVPTGNLWSLRPGASEFP